MPTRRPTFGFGAADEPQLFLRNNSLLTTFFAALSSTFPPGEQEFVRSVMLFADDVKDDPDLTARVRDFARQEGQHSALHTRCNQWLDSLGFDATRCMKRMAEEITAQANASTREERLALTVGLEHLTAVLAHHVLSRPDLWEGEPEPVRELLLWHAVEEIEHKSVAFDVYMRCVGDRALLRRVFAITTVLFTVTNVRLQLHMLKAIRHRPSVRELAVAAAFFVAPKGVLPGIARHYASFYRGDFHPWDTDDRDLIEGWKAAHPELAHAA